ncbi:hypothetical protein BaRGS_00023954 [Batillaria attramentaria]|uniref:Pheromone biosynthesis activating neuropeptide n=1 Tax=Batillaria attramentaria TaxID=370345 RepID=A0ABD0KCF0_9CAEN
MTSITSTALTIMVFCNVIQNVTSFPEMIAADYSNIFQNPYLENVRRQHDRYLIANQPQELNEVVPNDADLPDSERQDIDLRSSHDADNNGANIDEVQGVLALIEQSLLAMERSRANRIKAEKTRSKNSGKREPVSHFVRIGRGNTDVEQYVDETREMPSMSEDGKMYFDVKGGWVGAWDDVKGNSENVPDGVILDEESPYTVSVLGDFPGNADKNRLDASLTQNDASAFNDDVYPLYDVSSDLGVSHPRDDDDTDAYDTANNDVSNKADHLTRYRRDYSFFRYGRSNVLRSSKGKSLLRFVPRNSAYPPSGSLSESDIPRLAQRDAGRSSFSRFARSGRENGGRIRHMGMVSPVARRSSYIRIGRLPSSVFLRRVMARGQNVNSAPSKQPSRGYRLTTAGVVRAGK